MKANEEIKSIIRDELKEFEKVFSKSMKSNTPLLNIVINYLLKRKGKQIRPVLVFLTAKMISQTNEKTQVAASMIELLHTATLVHDDVVDDANERRGFLSINAIWKSKIAVLLGDYLLAKGLLIAVNHKAYDLLEIVSEATQEMIQGEILQMQKTRKLNIIESEYFEIIRKKTAVLLASCTASGAKSVTDDPVIVQKMNDFGLNLGIAFQIKDDIFDYEKTSIIGKPKGNDIKEKKLTLPLISALEKSPKKEGREIIRLINKKSSKRDTYNRVYKFVHEYGGLDYAKEKMMEFHNKALLILKDFPENESRIALEKLTRYIVERNS